MSLQVRKIANPEEIADCVKRFEVFVGVRMPLEYVQRGTVYGCFDETDRLVGGYMLVVEPPYRGVVFLPDQVRKTHWFFRTVSPNQMLEVNAVWLDPRVRLSAWDWYVFWWQIVRSLRAARRPYVLVWYNHLNSHLRRFYGRIQKEAIYTGPAGSSGGAHTHAEICVAFTTPGKLQYSLLAYLPKMLWIRFRRRLHAHQRPEQPPT